MKKVLITGAFSGIGLAASKLFLERGDLVYMMGKTEKPEIQQEILGKYKDRVLFFLGDVRKENDIKRLFDFTIEKTGGVDCIINNAGIITHGYLHEMSSEIWDDVMETDVKSIFFTTKYFIPHLIEKGGGTVVNTASISGLEADYKMPVYNTAKGAVVNLTRAMALDYGKFNIRVNSVCPGATDTPMVRNGSTPIEAFADVNPLRRICEPIEIAKAMYFLASDEASYCNGVNLPVTGGLDVHTGQPQR